MGLTLVEGPIQRMARKMAQTTRKRDLVRALQLDSPSEEL